MAKVSANKVFRLVHYWTSLAILLTGGLVAVSGLLLLLKKDVDWIQPPVAVAARTGASTARVDLLFESASRAAPRKLSWDDIDRIDVRPSDGIAKVITSAAEEYQVDLHTLKVIGVAQRRSDIIESIHDGSFFGSPVKYLLMIPSGVALLILWISGVYLFVIVRIAKARKKRR